MARTGVVPALAHPGDRFRDIFGRDLNKSRRRDQFLVGASGGEKKKTHRAASIQNLFARKCARDDDRVSEKKTAAGSKQTVPFAEHLGPVREMIHRIDAEDRVKRAI